MQVLRTDLVEDDVNTVGSGMTYVRYVSIAARIKEEMAQKRLLAPYESSLIQLSHQILVLEKVMQGVQTQVKSDIIQRFGKMSFKHNSD